MVAALLSFLCLQIAAAVSCLSDSGASDSVAGASPDQLHSVVDTVAAMGESNQQIECFCVNGCGHCHGNWGIRKKVVHA